VDGAFWCTYKYLNNGPGGIGGLYLNRRHFGKSPGLTGWFSSEKSRQFEMGHTLHAASTAGAMQIGTPEILSLALLRGALSVVAEAGIERIRRKSLAMTNFLMRCVENELDGHGFSFANPRDDARRGGHVALVHQDAERICGELNSEGVVVDFRPPRIIRLAPVALYNTFAECREAVRCLAGIM
jgi:kynureninase